MSSNIQDIAIKVTGLSKCYQIYDRPNDRLKQFIVPRLQGLLGRPVKQYCREFWALKDVSFDVKKGETVGIVGRNGSGKSTLLQLLCGTLTPTMGNVNINGRIAALLELGAGFNIEFTGRENVYLTGAIIGINEHDMASRIEKIISFADIGKFIDSPVKQYSSGMFARLAFSVAIHIEPDILIVDEILAVGDALFQKKCLQKFYELRDSGCTILFVSHDAYQVRSVCSKALYLKNGKQIIYGDADNVIGSYMADLEEKGQLTQTNIAANESKQNLSDFVDGALVSLARILEVRMLNESGQQVRLIKSGDTISIVFTYTISDITFLPEVTFVINLYRHDDFYICGTTTKMEGIAPFTSVSQGVVRVEFPNFELLTGKYKWRVAINDAQGLGIIAEAVPVCEFEVNDDFQAVGLINLQRKWFVNNICYK